MLESYLSPYLLSYVNKYIKNIKPEDLQVSLWGGDLILAKLDLNLDVLERELGHLPLTFLSGHIQELKIHIPWTAIGSEPAVITINTIQFVVKLRDSSDGRSESTSDSGKGDEGKPVAPNPIQKTKSGAELTPGYIQSLTQRIINNAHVIINNLILKYVEEDIVLSVNIKSLETFAVNEVWEKAFIELSLPELVLRRLCNFTDITVCLDKRNASGKIEIYQEPVIFHWNLMTRVHMTFSSLTARVASIIKVSTFCEELHFSLTETQLPMYIRLGQLILALYYDTLDLTETERDEGEQATETPNQQDEPSSALTTLVESDEPNQEGWTGWMWSLVPEVLSFDEEEEASRRQSRMEDTIMSVGFYCREGSFTFKLNDVTDTSIPFTPSKKVHVQPFLQASSYGMSLELLMQGLSFFSTQLGISHMSVQGLANCTCGVDDYNITLDDDREFLPFITSGTQDLTSREINYLTGSLFDPLCPENQRKQGQYILNQEEHNRTYTEEYGATRFGGFWSDYVFTMTPIEDTEGSDSGSSNSSSLPFDPIFEWRELSWKRFILYPCQTTVSSSLVHRLQQLVFSAGNHEYEPYSTEKPEVVDESRPGPTPEQVALLEEHVPTRSTQFSLLNMDVKFLLAEHPPFTAGPSTLCAISDKEPPMSLPVSLLPSLYLRVERLDLQTTVPMYPRRLVRAVSKLSQPSSDLIHYCSSHTQFKVFGLEAGLSQEVTGKLPQDQILFLSEKWLVEPVSAAGYQKRLALPMYWADPSQIKTEVQLELPKLNVTCSKPDLLMMSHLYHSWVVAAYESDWLFESTLMDDVFVSTAGAETSTLNASLSGVDVSFTDNKQVWAVTGSLQGIHLGFKSAAGGAASIMEGPADTSHQSDGSSPQGEAEGGLVTFTVQMNASDGLATSDGVSVMFLDVHGMAFCLDPSLLSWIVYQPKPKSAIGSGSSQQSLHHMMSQDNQGSICSQREISRPGPLSPNEAPSLSEGAEATSSSRWKEQLHCLAMRLQEVVVQVNIHPAVLILPTESVPFKESQSITDILLSLSGQSEHQLLVIRTPSISVLSSGHHHIRVIQEIPLDQDSLPQGPGSKFPWSVKADSLEVSTVGPVGTSHSDLLEPLLIASTVAFNCDVDKDTGIPSVGIVVHTDIPGIQANCSHEQIELLRDLTSQLLERLPDMRDSFRLRPKWLARSSPRPSRTPARAVTMAGRPVTVATTPTLTRSSRTSSDHLIDATGTPSSPMDSVSQEGSDDNVPSDHSSVRLSLWIQWTVDKVGACMLTRKSQATGKRAKLCLVSEDLTTSIDYHDVFSKVTCKVGSLNIRHLEDRSDGSWIPGCYSGVLVTSSDLFTKALETPSTTPRSLSLSKTKSLLRKSEHKFTDSKQSHGFLSVVWTRARGSSVSRHLEGREEVEGDIRVKHRHFVNEIILSLQPVDTVLWFPVIAETLKTFLPGETGSPPPMGDSGTISIQPPAASKAKPVLQPGPLQGRPRKSRSETPSHSRAPTSTVSTFDQWFTNSSLPLVYCDLQEMRCFLPVGDQHRPPAAMMDVFLFKVSHVKLVPYADNPLPRMVLKKEMFRRAQHSHSSQKPGSLLEDRQYQLDITSLGLFISSWEDISRLTKEEKRSIDPEVVASQNPALEWNTSPPQQDHRIIAMSPVIAEFSVCCVAAPAITIKRLNAERTASKPVIVCGHSIEGNISSDMCLYLSLNTITMAQGLLTANIRALIECLPEPIQNPPPPQSPQRRPKHRHSRADSGFDSDVSHRSHDRHSNPNPSLGEFSPGGIRVVKQKYRTVTMKPATKPSGSQARKVIPFDVLFTARDISVFLFSRAEDEQVCPFLLMELSQPSLAVSVSRRRQKAEISLYNMRVNGSSSTQTTTTGDLPTVSDFPLPWLETCPGEPNAKTGVRPALLTLSFMDFLIGGGVISLDIGRPVRGTVSIQKADQLLDFAGQIRSKFLKNQQLFPQPEKLHTASSKNPFAQGLPISESVAENADLVDNKSGDTLNPLAMVRTVALATAPCVVAIGTGSGCDGASCVFSLSSTSGNVELHQNTKGDATDVKMKMSVSGVSMKTGRGQLLRPMIGPVTVTMDAATKIQNKTLSVEKTVSHVTCGHIPVYFGQEHFNSLCDLAASYGGFLRRNTQDNPVSETPKVDEPSPTPVTVPAPRHSKDDLRSGDFVYIIESEPGPPLPNQIQFQAGGPETNHDGTMTWHYPEPRVLTRITMTPIPLRTASNDAENDEEIDVPCSLEYWDEVDRSFQHYKDLFVSETNTYHISMGLGQRSIGHEGAVAASMWRIVQNPGSDESNRRFLEEQNVILSPMAIAASLRVDSCHSPAFIPTASVALRCGVIDVHLENHLSQLGRATPERLHPFTFDATEPNSQEFCRISVSESLLSAQLWTTLPLAVKMKLTTNLRASLLNYAQLTMVPLISNLSIEGAVMLDQAEGECSCEVNMDSLNVRVGQGSVHTLINVAQSWMNNLQPDADRVVSAHYILCNNTELTLRLGQVDTDESIELATRMMHPYCWRSHKQSCQMLHVSTGDSDESNWSEPFSVDGPGTAVTTVQYKDQHVILFVGVQSIKPLQKQITFHAQQSFINHLTIPVEIHLLQGHPEPTQEGDISLSLIEGALQPAESESRPGIPATGGEVRQDDSQPRQKQDNQELQRDSLSGPPIEGAAQSPTDPPQRGGTIYHGEDLQPITPRHTFSINAESSLPSVPIDDSDLVGFRVRLQGKESDWSEQFAIAGEMKRDRFIIEVPRPNNCSLFFCCAILEESHSGHVQRAILFSPCYWVHNYSPHSLIMNLTCRRNPGVQITEVQGFGTMTPLFHFNPASPYLVTFQLNSDTSPSNPPIPISFNSDLFVVVPKEPTRISDLLFRPPHCKTGETWPYHDGSISQSVNSHLAQESVSQPDTDLNIHLSQDWSHVDSIVINVEPWCLVANETELDLTITDAGGLNSHIPRGVIMAPPKIQGWFCISVSHRGLEGSSQPVTLEDEKISPYMRPDQMKEKHVFIDSHVTMVIPFSVEGLEAQEACYLVVQSEVKENIRLLRIRPKLIVVNETEREIALTAVELGDEKKVLSEERLYVDSSRLFPRSTLSSVFWKRCPATDSQTQSWKQGISMSLMDVGKESGCQATSGRQWSKWVHINTENTRQPIPVPIHASSPKQFATEPWVATLHEERGVTYLSLGVDPCPRMVIINNCSFPLHVGQAAPGRVYSNDIKVLGDTQQLPELTLVPPQQMVHYSYHTSHDSSEPIQIRLAVAPFFNAVQLPKTGTNPLGLTPEWSDPVTIATTSSTTSEIIPLSTGSFVLVSSHVIGSQTKVNVEPLSMESSTSKTTQGERSSQFSRPSETSMSQMIKLRMKVALRSANLSLMDETVNLMRFEEVVSLHADRLHFLSEPQSSGETNNPVQRFIFAVTSLQVDNKAHTSGRYDFPVVFKGKGLGKPKGDDDDTQSFEELVSELRAESFMAISASTHLCDDWPSTGWRDLLVHFSEAEVFIEDQFISDILHFCHSFPEMNLTSVRSFSNRNVLPSNVACTLAALKGPISLQQLTIQPITALASVHASIKFFVAVDRTSLSFSQFHTGPVFATASQLGQALSLHYSSGAIFKAGWVLGSLEILGNPAGLLRSVGSGLADTIILPYEGLIRGPTAFIAGVAGGLSSLVWQVTAGTLTSVTKFATSVSRNLDRLSLDSDHMLRQETARRRVPNRTTEGITQGLSHFGISLLGAIAGIADQPIRSFQRAGSVDEGHAGSQAKEVLSGFGKGLVGAVVKPIGGAAELVSQTGQGILHGTGLAEVPKQLFPQAVELRTKFSNAEVKYIWKMLPVDKETDVLMVTKVTSITQDGLHHSGALILTSDMLFITINSEDTYQRSLPLDLSQCLPVRDSEEGVQIVTRGYHTMHSAPEVPETSDLIADFVDVSSSFIGSLDELPSSGMEEKLAKPVATPDSTTLTYVMNRRQRTTFLGLFKEAKRKLAGLGFKEATL